MAARIYSPITKLQQTRDVQAACNYRQADGEGTATPGSGTFVTVALWGGHWGEALLVPMMQSQLEGVSQSADGGQAFRFPNGPRCENKLWRIHVPWTEGLCSLFGSVQEELLSQWRALPTDSLVREIQLTEQAATLRSIVVPLDSKTRNLNRKRPGRKPRLPLAFVVCAGNQWRKELSTSKARVSDNQLRQIAAELDAAGHLRPTPMDTKADLLDKKKGMTAQRNSQ